MGQSHVNVINVAATVTMTTQRFTAISTLAK